MQRVLMKMIDRLDSGGCLEVYCAHSFHLCLSTRSIIMSTTSLKEALRRWDEENKGSLGRATEVILSFRNPPIQKLDNSLSMLTSCEFLSLSSNIIEKITGLQLLKNLKIISLSRNNIKDLTGLEAVAGSLEQLWVSYNNIEKTKVLTSLTKLTVLYMAFNQVRDVVEVNRLVDLPILRDFVFHGNPYAENMDEEKYRADVGKRLPQIKVLDGESIIREHILG